MKFLSIAVMTVLMTGAAHAEVIEQGEGGFRIKKTVEIAASPDKVYAALGEIGRWWDDAHTYSGKAANMSMKLEPGACFCETLPKRGGVRHGVVVLVWPDQRMVRLDAALGPLQDEPAIGALTFQVKPKGAGSELVETYNVSGLRPAAAKSFAGPVDGVMSNQVQRLKSFVETGRPK